MITLSYSWSVSGVKLTLLEHCWYELEQQIRRQEVLIGIPACVPISGFLVLTHTLLVFKHLVHAG